MAAAPEGFTHRARRLLLTPNPHAPNPHTPFQVPFYTNATQWGEIPTGGYNGSGDGAAPRRTPSECSQACVSVLNVRCMWRNKCWGKIGGFFGLVGGLLAGGAWARGRGGDRRGRPHGRGRGGCYARCPWILQLSPESTHTPSFPAAVLLVFLTKLGLLSPLLSCLFGWMCTSGRSERRSRSRSRSRGRSRGRSHSRGRGRDSTMEDSGSDGSGGGGGRARRGGGAAHGKGSKYRPSALTDDGTPRQEGGTSWAGGWPQPPAGGYPQQPQPYPQFAGPGAPSPPPRSSIVKAPSAGCGSAWGSAFGGSGGGEQQQGGRPSSTGRFSAVHGGGWGAGLPDSGAGGVGRRGSLPAPPPGRAASPSGLAAAGRASSAGGARPSARYEASPHASTDGLLLGGGGSSGSGGAPRASHRASAAPYERGGQSGGGARQSTRPSQLFTNPEFDPGVCGGGGGGAGSQQGDGRRGASPAALAAGGEGPTSRTTATLRRRSSSSGRDRLPHPREPGEPHGTAAWSRPSAAAGPLTHGFTAGQLPPRAPRQPTAAGPQGLRAPPPAAFDRSGPGFLSAPGGSRGGGGSSSGGPRVAPPSAATPAAWGGGGDRAGRASSPGGGLGGDGRRRPPGAGGGGGTPGPAAPGRDEPPAGGFNPLYGLED
jgi:hypothetical protein